MKSKNTRRSIDLLKTLTPKQQAALLMEAVAEGNENECQIIRDAVELRTYQQQHTVFTDWRDAMHRAGLLITAEYWRQEFLQACDVMRHLQTDPDTPAAHAMAERLTARLLGINAMLQAFEAVCTENGFNYESTLNACTPSPPPSATLEPCNEAERDEWAQALRGTMPSYAPHQGIENKARQS